MAAAMVLLGGSPVVSAESAAGRPMQPGTPQHAVAGSSAAPLLTGRILSHGGPLAAAVVSVDAWPNATTLASMPTGAMVDIVRVATVRTSSDGSYRVPRVPLGPQYREADGAIDLQVEATSHGQAAVWEVPGATSGSRAAARLLNSAGAAPVTLSLDLASRTATIRSGDRTRTRALPPEPATTGASGRSTAGHDAASGQAAATSVPVCALPSCNPYPPFEGGCEPYHPTAGAVISDRPERFIRAWSSSRAHATITETSASAHTVGLGVEYSNSGWSVNGNKSTTTNIAAGASDTYAANYVLTNLVQYRHFTQTCYKPGGSVKVDYVRYAGFQDLLSTKGYLAAMQFGTCYTKTSGTYFKSQGSNSEFSKGVSLPFMSLNSQASFSQDTNISWHVTGRVKICGSNGQGWVQAPQAGVRNYDPPPPCEKAPCT